MAEVTFDDASRCPKCKHPGEVDGERPSERGSTIYTIWCRNQICLWYNTSWIVQRLADGTIPVRDEATSRVKSFPKIIRPAGHDVRVREKIKKDADDTKPGP